MIVQETTPYVQNMDFANVHPIEEEALTAGDKEEEEAGVGALHNQHAPRTAIAPQAHQFALNMDSVSALHIGQADQNAGGKEEVKVALHSGEVATVSGEDMVVETMVADIRMETILETLGMEITKTLLQQVLVHLLT